MTVAFNNMPGDIRAPLFYGEINGGPPPYSGRSPLILLGRKLGGAASNVAALTPTILGGVDPNYLFGFGSMLAEMCAYARWINPTGEIWAMDVGDPVGATARVDTLTFAGSATGAGTFERYLNGENYAIGVAAGDTPAVMAAAFAAAVNRGYAKFNRRLGAPVVATAAAGVVTLTARHAGTEGNAFRLEAGLNGDELDPAGVTAVLANTTPGAGNVDLVAALAAFGSRPFDWIASPYASIAQLNAARDFLSDAGGGRNSPTVALDGHYITFFNGNLSAQQALGAVRNDRHCTILAGLNYPQAPHCWAAALGAMVQFTKNLGRPLSEAIEIARPMQTLVLAGLRPPKAFADRWALADREQIYRCGMSAVTWSADDEALIDRVLTTYQTNVWGTPDTTFLDIEAIAIALYVKRYFRLKITTTYPRHALRADNPRNLQGVATPDQIKATLVHAYIELSEIGGVVERPDLFQKFIIVEIASDPNRVDAYLPVDATNQLRVFAANITLFQTLTDTNGSLL